MTDPTKPAEHDGPRDPDSVIFLRSPRAQPCPLLWRSAPSVVLGAEGWEDQIRAEPDRMLVAWGGDGTLQAAARLERPCALVAAGTGNDVAADLGLPRGVAAGLQSLAESARWCALPMSKITVVCGEEHRVHPMVNAVSMGLGGAAAAKLGPFRRFGPLAYPLAAVRALASTRRFGCQGEFVRHVVVARGGRHGGGVRIGPRGARWSEELRMGRWTNWSDLLRGAVGLLFGRTVFSTRPFLGGEIVFDRRVPIEIDGEPMQADRVKVQALSPPLLLRVPHRSGPS